MKTTTRAAAMSALTAMAVAGLLAAGPTASATTQGCTVSTFTVQWGTAGVYGYESLNGNYYQIDTKSYGEVVKAPTGSESGPYRRIYYQNRVNTFMKKDSLNYVRCD